MTEPVLSVERVNVTPAMASHPLATRTGVAMMGHLLVADRVWSGCTKPQRSLLADLCAPVAAALVERGQLAAEDLPVLPDTVRQSTRDALRKRGLTDADGRITGKAVHAYWWTVGRSTGGDS